MPSGRTNLVNSGPHCLVSCEPGFKHVLDSACWAISFLYTGQLADLLYAIKIIDNNYFRFLSLDQSRKANVSHLKQLHNRHWLSKGLIRGTTCF